MKIRQQFVCALPGLKDSAKTDPCSTETLHRGYHLFFCVVSLRLLTRIFPRLGLGFVRSRHIAGKTRLALEYSVVFRGPFSPSALPFVRPSRTLFSTSRVVVDGWESVHAQSLLKENICGLTPNIFEKKMKSEILDFLTNFGASLSWCLVRHRLFLSLKVFQAVPSASNLLRIHSQVVSSGFNKPTDVSPYTSRLEKPLVHEGR